VEKDCDVVAFRDDFVAGGMEVAGKGLEGPHWGPKLFEDHGRRGKSCGEAWVKEPCVLRLSRMVGNVGRKYNQSRRVTSGFVKPRTDVRVSERSAWAWANVLLGLKKRRWKLMWVSVAATCMTVG
jgi:hypothetical protein